MILRLAHENPHWGYQRIVGELKGTGISVSATSVRKVLLEAGLPPAPQRTRASWRAFLRAQAASVLACDFLTVDTILLQQIHVLFFISLGTRRIEYIACTSNPDGKWTPQQARNLIMQLGDAQPFRFLIHDRDSKFGHSVTRATGFSVWLLIFAAALAQAALAPLAPTYETRFAPPRSRWARCTRPRASRPSPSRSPRGRAALPAAGKADKATTVTRPSPPPTPFARHNPQTKHRTTVGPQRTFWTGP